MGRHRLIVLGLVVAGVAVYLNSFHGAFVLDDQSDIIGNLAIRQLWPVNGILGWPPPIQRPVAMLTFAANYAWGGLHMGGYHAVNLLMHLLAGLVLYGLVRRTLLLHAGRKIPAPEATAGAIALLWLVHPLQTESVTYIIQRAESFAGFCHFLVLYACLRAVRGRQGGWGVVAVTACLVGMGVKESMVVAPLAVILYDRGFRYKSFGEAILERWKLYAWLASTWLVLVALLWAGPPQYAGLGNARFTLFEYIRTQPGVILHYLGLCIWPNSLLLSGGQNGGGVPSGRPFHLCPVGTAYGAFPVISTCLRRRSLGFPGFGADFQHHAPA